MLHYGLYGGKRAAPMVRESRTSRDRKGRGGRMATLAIRRLRAGASALAVMLLLGAGTAKGGAVMPDGVVV